MLRATRKSAALLAATALLLIPVACSRGASPVPNAAGHPNSIQPETTLNINAEASMTAEPDLAWISSGVQSEAKTAQEAMAANAKAMNGVFKALQAAGIDSKDMQTSNFSLNPVYEYETSSFTSNRKRVLKGYEASNQLSIRVRDLTNLGKTMDSLVAAGGNTFSGLRFALDDDGPIRNQAREKAMALALEKAELYAKASGLTVYRIVTINEGGDYSPQPMAMQARMMMESDSSPTPIAAGELNYNANVSVTFELRK